MSNSVSGQIHPSVICLSKVDTPVFGAMLLGYIQFRAMLDGNANMLNAVAVLAERQGEVDDLSSSPRVPY